MALSCFQKAHSADRTFADPLAGIALTSITLAAQSETSKSIELIRQARVSAEEALALDPKSLDAQLATAMLAWQTLGRYRQAERSFQELIMVSPNHWQVRHQYGLLLLATHRLSEAMISLREAWQLHPLSMSVKVDHARAHWYGGNRQRAIQDATRLRDRYDDSILARGLLIDIHEQQGDYELAASVDSQIDLKGEASPANYFEARRQRLVSLPYGPFGTALNSAILQARMPAGLDDLALADLTDPMLPMLPLLLSVHPSFSALRSLPRAKELLPPEMK
jgi:tetratricopeptide (TPR) repeat protein